MSKQIDERVLSMQFDNRHFERNVSTTMSTLDKLKAKLNFSGASKGLNDLGSSVKSVNMGGLGTAVEAVTTKFSALQVMGVTALANITNSAVNAGKRMVAALTTEPIGEGWKEYEMTLNAVQTTMAGTGKTAEEVEKELKKLDEYADKTVYSTSDMLNNLPKFTNAGVELEKATTAMIGIANATALAGGDARQASIAFYNLGQAIGTGYLTRMDYNSINAGIATMEWKNQMVDAAIAAGTLTKIEDDLYAAGNKTYTLQQLFIDGLQEQWATTDVMTKVFGDYGDETTTIGEKAYSAAKDVKTFTQMMASLKATAGTGWKDTWQTLVGGLDEAKEFWTGINEVVGGFISSTSKWRNSVLETALETKVFDIVDKLKEPIKAVETMTSTLLDYDKVVTEIIQGKWGNSQVRWDALTEAGYDWAHAQNLVNERLGISLRRTTNYSEAQKDLADSTEKVNDIRSETLEKLIQLTDAELLSIGYTQEQVDSLRELKKYADAVGVSMLEFLNNTEKYSGRNLLIQSFKNLGKVIGDVFKVAKEAWQAIFPPRSTDEWALGLYKVIGALYKFTEGIKDTFYANDALTETGDKLVRTFKGVFAIVDLLASVLGGGLKLAFFAVKTLFSLFNLDILKFTAYIGDALVDLRDFVKELVDMQAIMDWMEPGLTAIVNFFKSIGSAISSVFEGFNFKGLLTEFTDWIEALKSSENLPADIAAGIVNGFGRAINFIKKLFKSIGDNLFKQFGTTPGDLIEGFTNGIWNGIKVVGQVIVELGKVILEKFRGVLGIHSPSTETHEIGKNFMQGFYNGLKQFGSMVWSFIMTFGQKCIDIIKELDFGKVISGIVSVGGTIGFVKIASGISKLSGAMSEAIGEVVQTINAFQGTLKAFNRSLNAEAMKNMAIAIAILAGSVFVLALIPTEKLWSAIGAIAVLSIVLAGLSFVIGKFGAAEGGIKANLKAFASIGTMMIAFAGSMIMLVLALKIIESCDPERVVGSAIILGIAIATIIGVLVLFSKLAKKNDSLVKAGTVFLGIGVAFLLMAAVIKMLGGMDPDKLMIGLEVVTYFSMLVAGLSAATKLVGSKDISRLGTLMMSIGVAMLSMAVAIRLVGGMDSEKLLTGITVINAFALIIAGLMVVTRFSNDKYGKLSIILMGVGVAMALMAASTLIISTMDTRDLVKGVTVVSLYGAMIAGLMVATRFAGDAKVRTTLLMAAGAVGILATIAVIVSLIDIWSLAKGIVAVGILTAMIAGLIFVTKFAQNCMSTLIVIAGIIALLGGIVIGMSFIDPKDLVAPTLALESLMGMLVLMMYMTKHTSKALVTMTVLSGVVALLAGILTWLAKSPAKDVLAAAGAISIVLLSLAGTLAILSAISKAISSAGLYILAAIGLIALLGLVMAGLTALFSQVIKPFVEILREMDDLKNVQTNAIGLSILMGTITVILLLLAGVGGLFAPVLIGIGLIVLLKTVIEDCIGLITTINNVPEASSGIEKLVTMMSGIVKLMAMLALVSIPSAIGVVALAGLIYLMKKLFTFFAMLTALDAVVGEGTSAKIFETGMSVIGKMFETLAASFSSALANTIKTLTGVLPEVGTNLSNFMTNVGGFIEGSKNIPDNLYDKIKQLGKSVVVLTAADLYSAFSTILQLGDGLPSLGTKLSDFMENLKPFIEASSGIKEDAMNGLKSLAEAVVLITGLDIFESAKDIPLTSYGWGKKIGEGIGELFGGTTAEDASPLVSFADELCKFAPKFQNFASAIATIKPEALETVKKVAPIIKTLAEVAKEIPNTGFSFISALVGDNRLDDWGEQLSTLGEELREFAIAVGPSKAINGDEIKGISAYADDLEAAIDVLNKLADISKKIPNSGWSVNAWFVGDNTLDEFGSQLAALGSGLRDFTTMVGPVSLGTDNNTLPGISAYADDLEVAIPILNQLADLGKKIPNGGWSFNAWFIGDNKLDQFGNQLAALGKGLRDFATKVKGISGATTDTGEAVMVAYDLVRIANTLPNDGPSFKTLFAGGFNTLWFAAQVGLLGTGLKNFAKNVDGISAYETDVNMAVSVAERLAEVSRIVTDLDLIDFGLSVAEFEDNLGEFADGVKTFNKKIENVDTNKISSITVQLEKLANISKGLTGIENIDVKSFTDNLVSLVTDGIKGMMNTIDSHKVDLGVKGADMVINIVNGAKLMSDSFVDAFNVMISKALAYIKDHYSSFYSAGQYLVTGFSDGIQSNAPKARSTAVGMARSVVNAVTRTLDINSPSKVGYSLGNFFGGAFVSGISDNVRSAYSASSDVATYAKRGLSNAIQTISSGLNADLDLQPTIRPVLDLSDVRSGAGTIGDLLNSNRSMGVMSNIGAISSMMNNNQNGGNSDVVSAINKLGKELGNMDRSQININGVSAGDDENVRSAIETIVRAATRERRT